MPENFASLGITDPFDPTQSIDGGAQMLAENLKTFGGNTVDALAAYNAGVGAVEQYGGVPPYSQTQNYVQMVMGYAAQYPGAAQTATGVGDVPGVAVAQPATGAATALPATGATTPAATGSTADSAATLDALYAILSAEAGGSGLGGDATDPSSSLSALLPYLQQSGATL
jgi:hypothetical protein